MGAAPSRETIEHSLPQPPFYGQRQQIVLIPLLKKFFPSIDCPLFVQLYEARCDPAVRYYYYANDGVEGLSRTPPTVHPTAESPGDDESFRCLEDTVGGAPFHCPPMEVFPDVPFSREAMYDAYVTNGGEKLVYDTDAEMLHAYRADPTSVRPMPCAVAFLYHKSTPNTAAAVQSVSEGERGAEKESEGAATTTTTAQGRLSSVPEDCSEVLGCYVKATGFVGDVQCLGRQHRGRKAEGLNYEMQMFLTKSAGDHNRTHTLFSAAYTYAEQWQRACLHCVPHDLMSPPAPPKAHTEEFAANGEALSDALKFYKPFMPIHDMLVEASRAGRHSEHSSHGAEGGSAATNFTVDHEEGAGDASTDAGTRGHTANHQQVDARYWAPPPLSALVLRSRRANVPLLCFLREARACITSMSLFHMTHHYHEHQQERQDSESAEELVAAAALGGSCSDQPLRHPDVLPPECWHMWLQNTPTACAEAEEMNYESVLNVHCTLQFMQSVVEYIVACLLHNLNPLEAFRSQPNRDAAANGNVNSCKSTACTDAAGADATHDRVRSSVDEGEASAATATAASKADAGGDGTGTSVEPVATTTVAVVPDPVFFFRLPDEGVLVDTWPPRQVDEAAAPLPTSVAADMLTQWKGLHCSYYLFWVVGPNVERRRSAAVALLDWVQVRKGSVVYGYHCGEHDCDIPSTPSGTCKDNIGYATYPSSSLEDYLCTVTFNGVDAQVLRGDTVLCLMPVTGDESTAERVLCVCRVPLEELLLGELRNASKLAREAGVDDPHWVRQSPSAQGTYRGCILRAPDLAAGATVVISNGVELPTVPPEADGIVGDGTSCLWRVDVLGHFHRVIAVTPQFLKPLRKKHPKKKKMPSKAVAAQGTATQVFLAAPNTNVGAADGAGEQASDTARETEQHRSEQGTEPVGATAAPTPERDGAQTSVLTEGKKAETGGEDAQTAAATDATVTPSPMTVSKNQKKKAKKAAAAAAALESSTGATAEAPSNGVATHETEETLLSMKDEVERSANTPHPESHEDSAVGAPAGKKARKLAVQSDSSSNIETLPTTSATEAAKQVPKPPSAVIPPRPIPAGELDPNVLNNINNNKSRSGSQQTAVTSAKNSAAATPAPSYSESNGWGYGVGHARSAAYPHGFSAYGRALPSYDAPHLYPTPPPPPPSLGAAAVAAGYGAYNCDVSCAYAQTGSAGEISQPPPPFREHSGGGYVPPGYESYYNSQDGCPANYAQDGEYTGNYYDPSYGPMQAEGIKAVGEEDGVPKHYGCEEWAMNVSEQTHEGLVTLVAPHEAKSKSIPLTEREGSDPHRGQVVAGSQETTSSSLQRHVSFGVGVSPTANAASTSSRVARWSGITVPPPLPLSGAAITSPMQNAGPSANGGTGKANGSILFSPQHSQNMEYPSANSLSFGGSQLHFQLDNFNSPVTNSNSTLMGPVSQHQCYARSPYQQQVSTFEEVGVARSPGTGPAGSSVNVYVRVRHHHHTHSRTTSFFSDSTADNGNGHHHHHAQGSHPQGGSSTSGMHPSHSFASAGSVSIVFQGAGGGAGSNHAGSMRERTSNGVGGDHSNHSHPHRHHIPGASSSTRSGETSTARLTDRRSGTYRWDWRTAGLNVGDED